ncbi:MAG: c-type cytochrome, partial [Roseibacillus sp.]|nr:c-type cytochrome [Roseibacillus sp.]
GWHHVCMTQDKGERFLFVDGHLAAYGAGSVAADGAGVLWIGGAPSVEEFFRGGINEVRIYQRALSAGEVSYLSDHPVGVAGRGAQAEERTPELFAHYREVLSEKSLEGADLEHGHLVFTESCGRCHTVNGEGGTAGPALSGSELGNLEYLLPHVLDPDGEIDEDYRYYKFELKDERVVLGVIAGESAQSYTLESNVGRFELEKASIAHRDVLPYSLMPDAVFQTMTDTEVRDLVAFLRK